MAQEEKSGGQQNNCCSKKKKTAITKTQKVKLVVVVHWLKVLDRLPSLELSREHT